MKKRLLLPIVAAFLLVGCDAGKCEHHIVIDQGKDATCTESGLTHGAHCDDCDEVFIAQQVIDAKGHHVVIDQAKEATCTESGLTEGSHCDVCGEVIVAQKVVEAKGHHVVIDKAKEATCKETGLTEGSHCDVCGEVIVAQHVIEKKEHHYVYVPGKDPTCTQNGLTPSIYCDVCGASILESEKIKATGHHIVQDPKVYPTCTEPGLTAGSHCDICGEVIVAQKPIDPMGHIEVVDPGREANCMHTGLSEGSHCRTCGEILVPQVETPKTEHHFVLQDYVAPTCTETGLSFGVCCDVCGEVLDKQEVIAATGHHEVQDPRVEPTCTEPGLTAGLHCDICGKVTLEQRPIDATGHTPVIDAAVEATCGHEGLTEGSHCAKCGEVLVEQKVLPKLKHHYVYDDPVDPTCTSEGKTMGLHCDICGEVFIAQDYIDMAPHTKGDLLEIVTSSIKDVENPGLFECKECGAHYYDTIKTEDIKMPVVSVSGDMKGMTKEKEKKVVLNYEDSNQSFSAYTKMKHQGGTSLMFDKKNYNIKLYKDDKYETKQKIKLVDAWGKQNKYTLKANYVDYSQMRNIVTAQLWGDIVKSRNIDDEYNKAFNGGAIDGFPIVLYLNGTFNGLYTLNTAKDNYIFGMDGDETTRQAMLMCSDRSDFTRLAKEMYGGSGDGFEIEYASTEDDEALTKSWITESFNNMVRFLNNSSNAEFKSRISEFTSVPRVIDSMLLTWMCRADDNTDKNILWSTYDGTHWTPTVYDLDGTWGAYWDGSVYNFAGVWKPTNGNKMWERIWANFYDEIVARYKELRDGPLSMANIDKRFTDFRNAIPAAVYAADSIRWPAVPSQKANHVTQIGSWTYQMLNAYDNEFGYVDSAMPFRTDFVNSNGSEVKVYFTSDYDAKGDISTIAITRDGDTGYVTADGGQINFEVLLPSGYEIEEVSIKGKYKNLKGPEDTKRENTYRITKISGNLTVTVKTKAIN